MNATTITAAITAIAISAALIMAVTHEVKQTIPSKIMLEPPTESITENDLAPKSDKGLIAHAVKTIVVFPMEMQLPTRTPPITVPNELPKPQPPPPKIEHVGDICQRHGGHREDYSRGKWHGWHCVFNHKAT